MDTADVNKLNDTIEKKGQSLARLVLKRITHTVKQSFPDARTVRLSYDGDNSEWRVTRVVGPHNATLWRDKLNDRLVTQVGTDADIRLTADANRYVELGGARLYRIKLRKNEIHADYSLHLHRNVD